MNKIKALLIIAVVLLVSGCTTKTPFQVKEPLKDAALVYVYSTDVMSDDDSMQNGKFKLQINNKNVAGSIDAGEYKVFDMKPAVILMTALRTNVEKLHIKLNLEAGKTYYLRVEAKSGYGDAFTFDEVDSRTGKKDLEKSALAGSFEVDAAAYIPDYAGSTAGNDKDTVVAVPAMTEAEIDAIIERKIAERVSKMNIPAPVAAPVAAPAVQVSSPVPTYVTSPKASKMDEIQRAYDMKEKGILSQEDFNTIKAEILAK